MILHYTVLGGYILLWYATILHEITCFSGVFVTDCYTENQSLLMYRLSS